MKSSRRGVPSLHHIEPLEDRRLTRLFVEYRAAPSLGCRSDEAIQAVKQVLARLGGIVPPGMTRALPNGARVHYAGFLPMSQSAVGHGCRPDGPKWQFETPIITAGAQTSSCSRRPRTSPSPSWPT